MKPHRLAEYFPLLEGEEFEALKQDIKENGQLEPIVVYDGQILDGVNRYNACLELGVLPDTKKFNGDNPVNYVISANIRRRHLNISQRGVIATEMLPELERIRKEGKRKQAKEQHEHGGQGFGSWSASQDAHQGRATEEAAREFNVSMPTVVRAKRVKEQAPERIPDIMAGKTTLKAVDTELRQKRAAEKAAAKKDKQETKTRQEDDKEVAEYYNNLKLFKEHLKLHKQQVEKAIRVAEYGKFDPSASNFTANKHSGVIDLMMDIQNLYDDLERKIEG